MIVRILVGGGLFALGYYMGKEIGRAEYIRDQLRWASEDGELMSTPPNSMARTESRRTESGVIDDVPREKGS